MQRPNLLHPLLSWPYWPKVCDRTLNYVGPVCPECLLPVIFYGSLPLVQTIRSLGVIHTNFVVSKVPCLVTLYLVWRDENHRRRGPQSPYSVSVRLMDTWVKSLRSKDTEIGFGSGPRFSREEVRLRVQGIFTDKSHPTKHLRRRRGPGWCIYVILVSVKLDVFQR